MNASAVVERHVVLDGCANLRDLGGYETTDRRQTRSGTIFRADSLHRLPAASQVALLHYGIRTIIDLRHPVEASRERHVFADVAGVRYLQLPLTADDPPLNSTTRPARLHVLYALLLDTCMPRFRRALEAIAENPAPLVFHCTAGKDRTGLVAALLLGIARVAPVTIAADYALSSRYLTMMLPTFRQHLAIAGYDLDRDGWMLEAQPETMLQTLTYLDQRYGGAEGYAQRIGVAPQYIRELRRRLVE